MSQLVALYAPYAWFLVVWIVTPVALIIATRRWLTPVDSPPIAAVPLTRIDIVAIIALIVFVCIYAILIVSGEDLVGQDYAQLTAQRFYGMPIWPNNRRFFPLGLQEYNILGLLGKTAQVYHTFSIYQLLVVLPAIVVLLAPAAIWLRCVVCAFVMTSPSFVISFFGLIYPERDIIFWMAAWLVSLVAHVRNGGRLSFAAALISAQCLLYYKEIVFLLVAGFAAGKLVLDAQRDRRDFLRRHLLELSHLALCAVFVGVYFFAMRSATGESYAINAGRVGASLAAFDTYVQVDPLLIVLAVVVALRVVLVFTGKRAADPLWDSLAVGALIYVAAYIKLAMVRDYYTAPADFVAVIYLARVAYAELRSASIVVRAAVSLVVAVAFMQNLSTDAFAVLTRKEYVAASRQMVDALEQHAVSSRRDTVELFFPQVGGFQLMEFSAYLRYRGFRMLGDSTAREANRPVVVVKGPHRFPEDVCQPSQNFKCLYAVAPARGDLVAFLPGREVSSAAVEELGGRQVFRVRPSSSWMLSALRMLAPTDRLVERPVDGYLIQF